MSWYDNVFLAPPEDEPEPQMEIGTYSVYHNDVEYEVVVDLLELCEYFDTHIEAIYRWEEDGTAKIECSNELNDADYDAIASKILEMNKNDRD